MIRFVAAAGALLAVSVPISSKAQQVAYEKTTDARQIAFMSTAMDAVKARLRDPASAKFQNVYSNSANGAMVTCGQVNSKNGFGGYGGFEYFISNGGGVTVMRRDFASAKEFKDTWDKVCR